MENMNVRHTHLLFDDGIPNQRWLPILGCQRVGVKGALPGKAKIIGTFCD
jgi:hypothetical protein